MPTTPAATPSATTRVRLGRSGLSVSPICYGSWQLSPMFWGEQPEEVMVRAMRRAFEVGVNFYDTADAYGNGLSETVMGKALAELPRDQVVVATKVYWHFFPDLRRYGDLSRDYIFAECEASLRRLKMDYVDLYQCHAFDPLAEPAEIIDALETLRRQGKIRAYGTSNWSVEQMRMGRELGGDFSTCQPPYSLLYKQGESDVLPYCKANDIGTLVYSPLAKGLIAGKYTGSETFTDLRQNDPDFQGERFRAICERVQGLRPLAEKHGLSLVQLVLTATLMQPAITCAIVGIKNPEQIEEAAGAMGRSISREEWWTVRNALTVK